MKNQQKVQDENQYQESPGHLRATQLSQMTAEEYESIPVPKNVSPVPLSPKNMTCLSERSQNLLTNQGPHQLVKRFHNV